MKIATPNPMGTLEISSRFNVILGALPRRVGRWPSGHIAGFKAPVPEPPLAAACHSVEAFDMKIRVDIAVYDDTGSSLRAISSKAIPVDGEPQTVQENLEFLDWANQLAARIQRALQK